MFKVPAGAETMVIEMDGTTRVQSLLGPTASLPIHVVLTPSGVRYAYNLKSDGDNTEFRNETQVNLEYTPFAAKQLAFSPALNTWASVPLGKAMKRWKITFGAGQGLRKESDKISLNVLFTQKSAVNVKDSLRPPEKP